MRRIPLLYIAFGAAAACGPQQQPALTDVERTAIADTTKRIVLGVFNAVSHLDAAALVSGYAADPDVRPAVNGVIYTVESFRALTDSFYPSLERLDSKPTGEIRPMVLAADAAAAQVPFTFTIRTKSGNKVSGQGVYTALVQKRGGAWKIVGSHESVHVDEMSP